MTVYDVPVIPLWSTTVVEKVELVESCNRYEVAPVETFQLNVGLVDTPVVSFAGDTSVGATGAVITVVKLQVFDQPLVPTAFIALTRQKYLVLLESPLTV